MVFEEFSDANWITSMKDNKSMFGWIFKLGDGVVSWVSKKQTYVTYSIMESEFVALATTSKEAEWLKNCYLL